MADNKKTTTLDSHFFVFQNWVFALLKRVDHAHFLKAENHLFCRKQIVFALVKEANKSDTNGREERGSEGNQSSPTARTSGYLGTLGMESGQELASTLPSDKQNKTQTTNRGNFKINGGRKKMRSCKLQFSCSANVCG